jgi:hypothetical protein
MPTIIDTQTGDSRQVSDAIYEQLMRQVGEGTIPHVLQAAEPIHPSPASVKVAIWDCVEQAWTSLLPREQVYAFYLQKQVVKCSVCIYTSATAWTNGTDIKGHLETVREQIKTHKDAELSAPVMNERGVGTQLCTGCGFPFQVGKGMEHLIRIREMSASHIGRVEALLVNRFTLVPSELVVIQRQLVSDGPEVNQVEPSASPPVPNRSSRRRRRKRGSRGKGHNMG